MPYQTKSTTHSQSRNMNISDMDNPPYGQSIPNMQTAPMPTPMPTQTQMPMPMPMPSQMVSTPTTLESPYYTAGFLRQYIGQNMRVEYLLGTNGPLVDRIGRLVDVGASYIVLQPYLSDDLLMSDLYSIRFVTIYF